MSFRRCDVGIRTEDLRLAGSNEYAMPDCGICRRTRLAAARAWPYGRTAAEGGRLPETALAPELRFVITPQKLHFFAHDTGKRIGAGAAITAHHPAVADAIS
ncbi:hypothetical protein [Rhizobium sp. 007]|uniref:hypothetical protein n=1 Tax=Rhizobium sp. 007 TaxID=2785056 RepID=UPI00188F65AE|nr:hypothetical protein [Rhizobium sp. 007]QPB19927.1 hypothetical protein ISN39_20775 [Rhizobium sp. 007]